MIIRYLDPWGKGPSSPYLWLSMFFCTQNGPKVL